ncbi:MAG: carbamoyltransferase [Myxococcota bacterium]|jgi:carbamoyltransferase
MTTYILGLNAFHADSSAVLLKDGEVVAAIAEERLNRVKHYAGFPELAIKKVLEMGGIGIADVDHIAIGRDSKANLRQKVGFSLRNLTRIGKLAKQRLENRANISDVPTLVAKAFGLERDALKARVHNIEHHLCHAASCYLVSPYDRAAILSIDGFGDFASTMTAIGEGSHMKVLDRVHFPHSLGVFYTSICQFIGYDRYGDEGKVMGLAPYGKPIYMDFMRDAVRTTANGKFELNLDYYIHHSEGVDYSHDESGYPTVAPLYSDKLIATFGPPRVRLDEITQRDMDLARSLQARLEEVYFHILDHLYNVAGTDALCVAGGVSLNSVANGQLFKRSKFKRFYAHPAATDDGTAFGAAYFVHNITLKNPRSFVLKHAYLGDSFTDDEIAAALERAGVTTAKKLDGDAIYSETAKRMADGKVIGWFQGRMEWGPRALGARSIVAHPGYEDMKDILNARVKHRESFRPFAPSILEERTGDYFDETWPAPFMMQVYGTKESGRADIAACNHTNNTGRLQTVNRDDNPIYHKLISAFAAETGIPVVLNTSFNENEPIVNTPDQAISCFLRTKMDVLSIGSFIVDKPEGHADAPDGAVHGMSA